MNVAGRIARRLRSSVERAVCGQSMTTRVARATAIETTADTSMETKPTGLTA